jgi:hypothetical protein
MRYRITTVFLIVVVITTGLQVALASANQAKGNFEGQQRVISPAKGAYKDGGSRVFLPLVLANNTSEAPTPVPPTPTSTRVPASGLFGILSSSPAGFPTIASLGGRIASVPGHLAPSDLQAALDAARGQGLGLIARGPGSTAFTDGTKLNFTELQSVAQNVFGDNDIASDPSFIGWYIIDEPCADWKYDIAPAEFRQFYETIKGVDPNITVIVNFSWLQCAENLQAANYVDIAALTITVNRPKDHYASQAEIAARLKAVNPDLKVVVWIAVYEYPARRVPIPSADWVREKGMEVLQYDVFDGVMFYPWQPGASYFGATIQDVADDPEYISAFNDVFDAAMEKFGGE